MPPLRRCGPPLGARTSRTQADTMPASSQTMIYERDVSLLSHRLTPHPSPFSALPPFQKSA